MSHKIDQSLKSYKMLFENKLKASFSFWGEKTDLRKAAEYALDSGKCIRPIIVLMIADALNLGFDVIDSAIAVECFHAGSLIVDDLPCMDDEKIRRGNATLHIAYSESTALLASYSLIAAGYEHIAKNSQKFRKKRGANSDQLCEVAIETASKCGGILGATNGQFLDLDTKEYSLETIFKIIHQKTVTLFEVAFVLGWIFGGGELEQLNKVKKCAYHLGKAFQIADDILDIFEDTKRQCKINIACFLGEKKARELFDIEIKKFKEMLFSIHLLTKPFQNLIVMLENSIK